MLFRRLLTALTLAGSAVHVSAQKAVTAHFMISNSVVWSVDQWKTEINLAKTSKIDAFALNMATTDDYANTVSNAFTAAQAVGGFGLFFSFDYAGGPPWSKSQVTSLLKLYTGSSAYFRFNGKPLASTFEGPANAPDWVDIKASTGCVFIPDYSSLGANKAMKLGVADGLFSWAAWPYGTQDMDTYTDHSYRQYLGGKPYMMGVSPWFYTNLPKFKKNWAWRGDHLWFDRWQEVLYMQPELVQIITWNDYGESHYIGPLRDEVPSLFSSWQAPYNYVAGKPHDSWRMFLPYLIDTYKSGKASITREGVQAWYRLSKTGACSSNGTTVNTCLQFQIEGTTSAFQDRVFYSALLQSYADVRITIGGQAVSAGWSSTPDGGFGIYHGSAEIGSNSGQVVIRIVRSGSVIATATGTTHGPCGEGGFLNLNPVVTGAWGPAIASKDPPRTLAQQKCNQGTGAPDFKDLCNYTCARGYCPPSCTCTNMGVPIARVDKGKEGYPANGDSNYAGLCSFACSDNFCPSRYCSATKQPDYIPTISPFLPQSCTNGTAFGDGPGLDALCKFACAYGFCPLSSCICTQTGALNVNLPPPTGIEGSTAPGLDPNRYDKLCAFGCTYGSCIPGICTNSYDDLAFFGDDDQEPCDPYGQIFTMGQVENLIGKVRRECLLLYSMKALEAMLYNATQVYARVDNGYDEQYGYYVKYIARLVPYQLNNRVMFDGTKTDEMYQYYLPASGSGLDSFDCRDSDGSFVCKDRDQLIRSAKIPTTLSLRDATGFAETLAKNGLQFDWVSYGNYELKTIDTRLQPAQENLYRFRNFPVRNESLVVTNPKDVLVKGLSSIAKLQVELQATYLEMVLGIWDGAVIDAVQAYSVPVFMYMQAVESMAQARALAEKEQELEEKEQRDRIKKIIGIVVSVLLIFVPVVGSEIATAAGFTTMGRAVILAGELGGAAKGIYDTIDNPQSAFVNVLGFMIGVNSISKIPRDAFGMGVVAALKKTIPGSGLLGFGEVMALQETSLQAVSKACIVRP